jgi:ribonuclease HI
MIIIFTDGASRGNPGPGGWGAVVVYGNKVRELGGREDHTTNNRMEMMAALSALTFAKDSKEPITIYSDSSYLINGITKWVHGWKKSGWITKTKDEVLNRDLWERLAEAVQGKEVDWTYVGGHLGIAGNERCDEIATSCADGKKISLYDGYALGYTIDERDLKNIQIDAARIHEKVKSVARRKSSPAYSYVSLVDRSVQTHKTWTECEARVKGKSGAKFKKAISRADEQTIIADWNQEMAI